MLSGSGVTGQKKQLTYNGAQNVVSFAGAVFGAVFTDRWGRRRQLMVSTSLVIIFFTLICALNATNLVSDPNDSSQLIAKNPKQAEAIIAIIFLFGFVFSAGYTPLQALYPVECLRYESRAKGMGMYNFFVNIASFYNTFVTEIAFTGAGWKYYFLFIFWDAFEVLFIYLLFVETKNRTLEELTAIFYSKSPVKKSLETSDTVANTGDATVDA
jgi:MFS family permease